MSAVLRAHGKDFDPDRFCSESGLKPCKVYRKGEPQLPLTKPEGRKKETSGINIVISEAELHEFPRQVEEATAYLLAHKDELTKLGTFPGIETMTIDFGVARRDVSVQSDYLPPSLIRLAGDLGLGVEITQYWVDDEEDLGATVGNEI